MVTLRMAAGGVSPEGRDVEVECCSYTADGTLLVTGGFDGHLRLWETSHGRPVSSFSVSTKAITACIFSADAKAILVGGLDGMVTIWDSLTHQQISGFLAHPRPVSALAYGTDRMRLATGSWDGSLSLWASPDGHRCTPLAGHRDHIGGCRFTADGQALYTWSHDGTARLWSLDDGKVQFTFQTHGERVVAGDVDPSARYGVTASRSGEIKLWDLLKGIQVGGASLNAEPRGCFFTRDGESLVTADSAGRLAVLALPDLNEESFLATRVPVMCADLSPDGGQLAVGCRDGGVRLIALDGFDANPLIVLATRDVTEQGGRGLGRLFGQSRMVAVVCSTCPVCRNSFEAPEEAVGETSACPGCGRQLRIARVLRSEARP
jgi:WD40 repeat protein